LMMQLTVVFSDRHNELVWDEATRVVDELVKTDAWAGGKSVSIPHAVDLIEKVFPAFQPAYSISS